MKSDEHENKTRNIDKIQQNYIASPTFSWRLPEPKGGFREYEGIHLRTTLPSYRNQSIHVHCKSTLNLELPGLTTILVIIFWNFTMFWHKSYSPQVKGKLTSSTTTCYTCYLIRLRLKILKTQIWVES